MAKVKITGHASGSGVITVTAPNTSTDRTITLPDATATIATTADVAARLSGITDSVNTILIGGVTNTSGGYPFKIGDSGNDGELAMSADGDASQITSYDRTASAYHPIIMYASAVTMPLQPAFQATGAGQNNLAVSTLHTLALTERFDNNADFASNTFTAPVTGKYQLNLLLYVQDVDSASSYIEALVTTSNRTYACIISSNGFDQDLGYLTLALNVLADMDANDTVYVRVQTSGGTQQTDINQANTHFSGYLVC
jgi:hypothetical protein